MCRTFTNVGSINFYKYYFFKEGWISVVSFRLFRDEETSKIVAYISVSGRAGKLPNYHMYTTDFFRTTKIYIWKTELDLADFSLNVCLMKENKLLPQKDYWYLGLILKALLISVAVVRCLKRSCYCFTRKPTRNWKVKPSLPLFCLYF